MLHIHAAVKQAIRRCANGEWDQSDDGFALNHRRDMGE